MTTTETSEQKGTTTGASAEIAKVWKNAGKAVGLEIWRIEQFKVVPQPKSTYGTFYSGDSYIVLNTYREPGRSVLQWDVHFWLGRETTQDESGTAAYKTVELDDYLGGGPVEHREVQGHESQLFQSYFPHGLRILEGGVDSGFNKVRPKEYRPRLLHLKGRRHVRLTEVPLAAASVNSGDVFVLDLGLRLVQFNGKDSSGRERIKAAELCRAIVLFLLFIITHLVSCTFNTIITNGHFFIVSIITHHHCCCCCCCSCIRLMEEIFFSRSAAFLRRFCSSLASMRSSSPAPEAATAASVITPAAAASSVRARRGCSGAASEPAKT